jgi:hypothetical protein
MKRVLSQADYTFKDINLYTVYTVLNCETKYYITERERMINARNSERARELIRRLTNYKVRES